MKPFMLPSNTHIGAWFMPEDMIDDILKEKNWAPFFCRLAWHDSGTYDDSKKNEVAYRYVGLALVIDR